MKFKRGQLAIFSRSRTGDHLVPCIVLEDVSRDAKQIGKVAAACGITYYKAYLIKELRITYIAEEYLSTINPQEAESEV